jgi:hypothetical protein
MNIENLSNAFTEGEGQLPVQNVGWQDESVADIDALREVVQNCERARNFVQTRGLHAQWGSADELWEARVKAEPWPGTNISKSHLGIPLVQSHTTTLLNQITSAFFADPRPFAVDPRPGTQADVARANEAILQWELDQTDFQEEFELFGQSMLLYGTAIARVGWDTHKRVVRKYRRKGDPLVVPAGVGTEEIHPEDYDTIIAEDVVTEINRPYFINQNLKYILVDPQLRIPDIQKANYVGCIDYFDVNDLDALRDQVITDEDGNPVGGFKNIPPREVLELLVTPQKTESTMINPLETDNYGGYGNPRWFELAKAMPRWDDTNADPLKKPFMVVEYYTRDRYIVVLQNKLVIRNDRNPYGRIPFVSSVYITNPDSFYGRGIARLIGTEQQLQQGTINSALDIEHLRLSGAGVRQNSLSSMTQDLRLSPGKLFNVPDVNQFKLFQFDSMMPTAEAIMGASDQRAQRFTGANQISVQGQMPISGSNLFRTKAGIDLMGGGTDIRMQALVERLTNLVFIPTLEMFTYMNAENLSPSQYKQILSEELDIAYQGDTFDIIKGSYRFSIAAGARLRAQKAMVNLPFIMQFFADPNVMQHMAVQGITFDFLEWIKMASNQMELPNQSSLIRPMTDEEKKAYEQQQQSQAQAAQLQLQKLQVQGQIKSQLQSDNNEAKVTRDLLREGLKTEEGR